MKRKRPGFPLPDVAGCSCRYRLRKNWWYHRPGCTFPFRKSDYLV